MADIRFSQIEIGTEFSFQGDTYRKSTPLLAVKTHNNQQRMIPRSSLVELCTSTEKQSPTEPVAADVALNADEVNQIIDSLMKRYDQLLEQLVTPDNADLIRAELSEISRYRQALLLKR